MQTHQYSRLILVSSDSISSSFSPWGLVKKVLRLNESRGTSFSIASSLNNTRQTIVVFKSDGSPFYFVPRG